MDNKELSQSIEEKGILTIKDLCNKYENNNYILQRLNIHINILLSQTLETELKNYEKRIDRTNMLTNEQQIFIQVFLSKNHYYYLPNNSCFYEYNGKNYSAIKEDDILHKLLSTISQERVLLDWKYKTKINVIKQIKEKSLLKSIPETYTIQNVLRFFYPSFFSSKDQVKYFLTIIGDNILKKHNDLIVFINNQTKKLLNEIDNIAYINISHFNTTHNFMTKYHENHNYNLCRLLNSNSNFSIDILKDGLKKIGLDVLCVATHYSNRHNGSENFIRNKANEDLKKYSLYLENNTNKNIVDLFCNQYIEKVENKDNNKSTITWKNIHYLWKQFISNLSLPNIIYYNTLKNLLKEQFEYNETEDTFYNITSKFLPSVSYFINFWEENIYTKELEEVNFTNEIELDELYEIYKQWCLNVSLIGSNFFLNENEILKILQHFYSDIEIIDNKYIMNVYCKIYNKFTAIEDIIKLLKKEYKIKNNNSLIPFDDAYLFYCNHYSDLNSRKYISSKKYFEKYLNSYLCDYIVYDTFISNKWYQ